MSMIVTVKTEIRDYEVLERTVEKMHMHIARKEHFRHLVRERQEGSYTGTVLTKTGEAKCNIYRNGETYSLVAFSAESEIEEDVQRQERYLREGLDEIMQHYAVEEVLETARREGWNTVRTYEENGTVYLHLAV